MHTLVTFLGKANPEALRQHGGYRVSDYRFPDGVIRRHSFFGITLKEYLQSTSPLDRMVVLGTASSMWSVLIERLAQADEDEPQRVELLEREEAGQVDEATLRALEALVERRLGLPVALRLIDRAETDLAQRGILQKIADAVGEGEVSIDVTHGFRHLAMLGLVSGQMLSRARGVRLAGLWYGAGDMTDPQTRQTPVLRLDGLVAIQRWVEAIAAFDASGDYGVFAPLFEQEGIPATTARMLETAAWQEHVLNVADAGRSLRSFLGKLPGHWPGAAGLFQQKLLKRLAWIQQSGLAQQQYALAERALGRQDAHRAALLIREGLITAYCQQHRLVASETVERNRAASELEADLDEGLWTREVRDSIRDLRQIRNALAHGARPTNPRIRQLMEGRKMLLDALRKILQALRAQLHT
ncbi:MAG: TIGR02221 family CRISPR-associated protein [Xanthomonadales bacterium]|jgi:CRISPR-associated Csx2 family protein|nr:TIGR02221 family CRISPR-associated protein [Xanthomonadales bacterium]